MSRWKWISILLLSLLLLGGCNSAVNQQNSVNSSQKEKAVTIFADTKTKNDMKNVEERGYATILIISRGVDGKRYHVDLGVAQEKKVGEKSQREEVSSFDCNSFDELAEEYQLVKGMDLSLSHLKVILLEQSGNFQGNGQMFTQTAKNAEDGCNLVEIQELLMDLDTEEEIAKTCPVLELQEQEKFLEFLKKTEKPVGTYISDLISAGERQGKDIPWLKDYLKAVREGDALFTYALEPVSQGWKLRCSSEIQGTQHSGYE